MLGLKAELFSLQKVNLDEALDLARESEKIYEKYKGSFILDDFHIITACRIGDIYFAMERYNEAIKHYHFMKDQISMDNLYFVKMAYERLAKGYERLGEYKRSLQILKACEKILYEARRKKTDEQFETLHKHFIRDATQKEISRLNELNDNFEMDSIQDSLTGLFNRNYLNQYAGKRLTNTDSSVSLLMVDIDSFKQYNDHYGHEMGDMALIKVAGILKKSSKGITDKIVRYGGEEFLIILEHEARKNAVELAKKIIENMASESLEHEFSEVKKYITVSIGISTCISDNQCDMLKVIEAADHALYCSKKSGKNRFSHADCMCSGQ
jgi:diguanylate cyclase (GGDEF)-like protein